MTHNLLKKAFVLVSLRICAATASSHTWHLADMDFNLYHSLDLDLAEGYPNLNTPLMLQNMPAMNEPNFNDNCDLFDAVLPNTSEINYAVSLEDLIAPEISSSPPDQPVPIIISQPIPIILSTDEHASSGIPESDQPVTTDGNFVLDLDNADISAIMNLQNNDDIADRNHYESRSSTANPSMPEGPVPNPLLDSLIRDLLNVPLPKNNIVRAPKPFKFRAKKQPQAMKPKKKRKPTRRL